MTKILKDEFESYICDILEDEHFLETKKDLHHGSSKYEHSLRVAKCSFKLGKVFHADMKSLTRSALLHDFFIGTRKEKPENSYLKHPETAARNAKEYFNVSDKEAEDIRTHMFHHVLIKKILPFINREEKAKVRDYKPQSKEGWIICASDLIVSVMECERFQFSYVANVCLLLIMNIVMFRN